jgi:hypothetical protein
MCLAYLEGNMQCRLQLVPEQRNPSQSNKDRSRAHFVAVQFINPLKSSGVEKIQ